MSNPFAEPGWAWNRYMLSTAAAAACTLLALLPPLASLAGFAGAAPLAMSGYAVMALAAIAGLLRIGASKLKAPRARRFCLGMLQGLLWGLVLLAAPALLLNLAWLSVPGPWAGSAEERHVFAVIGLVLAVLAALAAINLAFLLRSPFWVAFRTFALAGKGAGPSSAARP